MTELIFEGIAEERLRRGLPIPVIYYSKIGNEAVRIVSDSLSQIDNYAICQEKLDSIVMCLETALWNYDLLEAHPRMFKIFIMKIHQLANEPNHAPIVERYCRLFLGDRLDLVKNILDRETEFETEEEFVNFICETFREIQDDSLFVQDENGIWVFNSETKQFVNKYYTLQEL